MSEYYTMEDENKFVEELKVRKTTLRSLQNSAISISKSKSLARPSLLESKSSDEMVKQRFESHLSVVKQSINNLEKQCSKFGGAEFIKSEMDRNQLEKAEYFDYYMSRINNQFQLPVIKQRSYSERALRPNQEDKQRKLKYNKWYIKPNERFSKQKEATKYEWSKEAFVYNIFQKKNQVIQNKFLPDFIAKSKEKIQRQPLFCKYTIVKKGF